MAHTTGAYIHVFIPFVGFGAGDIFFCFDHHIQTLQQNNILITNVAKFFFLHMISTLYVVHCHVLHRTHFYMYMNLCLVIKEPYARFH